MESSECVVSCLLSFSGREVRRQSVCTHKILNSIETTGKVDQLIMTHAQRWEDDFPRGR